MSIPKSSPESSSVSAPVGLHGQPQPAWLAPLLAGMHREKIRMREELGRNGRRTALEMFDLAHNVGRFAATLWPDWFEK